MDRRRLPVLLTLLAAGCGAGGPSYRGEKVSRVIQKIEEARDPVLQRGVMADLLKAGAEAAPVWLALLRHGNPDLAVLAADTLVAGVPGKAASTEPPPEVRETILANLEHAKPAVRAASLRAAGALWPDDAVLAPRVVAATGDSDREVRRAALRALRAMGPSTGGLSLEPVSRLLSDPALGHEAVFALAACGFGSPEIERHLAALIADPKDPARAVEAAAALAHLGPRAAGAAADVAKTLPGAPEGLAAALADALGSMGSRDPVVRKAVVTALVRALDRRDASVPVAAALALVRLDWPEPKLGDVLAAGLRAAPSTRVRAAEGLALLGRDVPAAFAALAEEASSAKGSARLEAVKALGRLAGAGDSLPPDARAALEAARKDSAADLRREAARALGVAGGGK